MKSSIGLDKAGVPLSKIVYWAFWISSAKWHENEKEGDRETDIDRDGERERERSIAQLEWIAMNIDHNEQGLSKTKITGDFGPQQQIKQLFLSIIVFSKR